MCTLFRLILLWLHATTYHSALIEHDSVNELGTGDWVPSTTNTDRIWVASSNHEICSSACIVIEGGHNNNYNYIYKYFDTRGFWDIEIEYDIGFDEDQDEGDVVQILADCGDGEVIIKKYTDDRGNHVILENEGPFSLPSDCDDRRLVKIILENYQDVDNERTSLDAFDIFGTPITPSPTNKPTKGPTPNPTRKPTKRPTRNPTKRPTKRPTRNPTKTPTAAPTFSPTSAPTDCAELEGYNSNDGRDITNGSYSELINSIVSTSGNIVPQYQNPDLGAFINCSLDDDTCCIQCDASKCAESIVEIRDRNMHELVMIGGGTYRGFFRGHVNISNSSIDNVTIICEDLGSCGLLEIIAKDVQMKYVNILCQSRDSCWSLFMNLDGVKADMISIYCIDVLACSSMHITTTNSDTNISMYCIDGNSCSDMEMDLNDEIYVDMIMYEYSNVQIIHRNFTNINIECDNPGNKRFVKYGIDIHDLDLEKEFMALARAEYNSYKFPCEGIEIICTKNQYFPQSCNMVYDRVPFDLYSLIQTNDDHSCYWFEISNAFDIYCDGNCGEEIELYLYNQTVDIDVAFHANPVNMSLICSVYFGDYNKTIATLSSIDALFEHVLSSISANDPFEIYDIIKSPMTTLRNDLGINCNESFDALNISSDFYLSSGIDNQRDFSTIFANDGPFMSDAEQLLSAFFKVPLSLNALTEEYNTTTGLKDEYVAAIVAGSLFIICIILLIVLYHRRKRKRKLEALTTYIHNPMVIAIAIGKYNKSHSFMKDYTFPNLDAIDTDIKNIHGLFQSTLNYKIFPKYNIDGKIKTHWKKKEIIDLLKKKGKALDKAVKKNKYDGLIVIISCHGIQGHIITSDYKRINKDTIHRIFSVDYPSLRDIPCIFVYDCCDGDNDRDRIESRAAKNVSLAESNKDEKKDSGRSEKEGFKDTTEIYGQDQKIWYKNEPNPDYKLVIINSSNTGFVSQMGSKSGSFMIQKFTEKMNENVEGRNKLFLNQILQEIQTELHDDGKQLIEAKYNNKLEYIKFKKNNDGKDDHMIELEQIPSTSVKKQKQKLNVDRDQEDNV